jgi:hypothetical protein
MRQLILDKLKDMENNGAEFYDWDDNQLDPMTFPTMTDEALLEVFEGAIGFRG